MSSYNENINNLTVRKNRKRINAKTKLETGIVISAVDSMASRKVIFERALASGASHLIDGRMGGQMFTIYTVNLKNKNAVKKYKGTFHEDVETPCTGRAIIYNTFGISSIIAKQVTNIVDKKSYRGDISFDYESFMIV